MKTAADALADIALLYPQKEGKADSEYEVSAGGPAQKPGIPPALYISPELALRAFIARVIETLSVHDAKGFVPVDGPHLDKWQITIQGKDGAHRIAEARWSVTAKIGVVK